MYHYRYKGYFSKSAKREFAQKMREIDEFCIEHHISQSLSSDSYYFTLNGKKYRISNHTIEQSNRAAFDEDTGEQIRRLYHEEDRDPDTIYILASKTRLIEIYNNLLDGVPLNGRGFPKKQAKKNIS